MDNAPNYLVGCIIQKRNDIFAVSSPKVSGMSRQHTVSQGGKLKMKCKVSGSPKPRIMWLKNDRPLHQDIRISIKTKRYTLYTHPRLNLVNVVFRPLLFPKLSLFTKLSLDKRKE